VGRLTTPGAAEQSNRQMALTNHPLSEQSLPECARWRSSEPYSIGVEEEEEEEEEVMILDPSDWTLAQETAEVFEMLPAWLADHAGAETHAAVIELTTDPHPDPDLSMFPRVGIPRPFRSYADYVEAIDMMLRSEACVPRRSWLRIASSQPGPG
jgi:hypothetical protein